MCCFLLHLLASPASPRDTTLSWLLTHPIIEFSFLAYPDLPYHIIHGESLFTFANLLSHHPPPSPYLFLLFSLFFFWYQAGYCARIIGALWTSMPMKHWNFADVHILPVPPVCYPVQDTQLEWQPSINDVSRKLLVLNLWSHIPRGKLELWFSMSAAANDGLYAAKCEDYFCFVIRLRRDLREIPANSCNETRVEIRSRVPCS